MKHLMRWLAPSVVWVALRFVPSQQRARYAAEFAGDLACLERTEAMSYAVSTLGAAPQLRLALVSGEGVDGVRKRSTRCLVGRHADVDVRLNPEDLSIVTQRCVRCHRVRDDERFPQFPHDQTKGETAWLINGQGRGW